MSLRTSDFDFDLPDELIAQRPPAERGQSRLLVLSSRLEGGANVISEAVVAGVPVIASRIAGSTGLLGRTYPGLFPVGGTAGLRRLLLRAERDGRFLRRLRAHCRRLRPLFTPSRERAAWRRLPTRQTHLPNHFWRKSMRQPRRPVLRFKTLCLPGRKIWNRFSQEWPVAEWLL